MPRTYNSPVFNWWGYISPGDQFAWRIWEAILSSEDQLKESQIGVLYKKAEDDQIYTDVDLLEGKLWQGSLHDGNIMGCLILFLRLYALEFPAK